jgi:integrase
LLHDNPVFSGTPRAAIAAPKTVNLEVGTLRAILKRRGLWAQVQPHVRMLPTSDDHGKALTEDEEKRLLEACRLSRSTALLPVVELALNTGMRLGEILNLRWGDVELKARRLVVRKSKTKAGTGRVVPLNDHAVGFLQFAAERFPDRQPDHYVFAAERYGVAGDDMATHAYDADPTKPFASLKQAWQSAKARAKVDCRFHDLRHTAVTRMLERGSPLLVVGSIVGWSPSTTARMAKRYAHIGDTAQRQAVELLAKTVKADEITTDQVEGGHKMGTVEKPSPCPNAVSC